MRKSFFVFTLSLLLLIMMAGSATAADFGLGLYDSHGLCLSGKYNLSRELAAQALLSSDSLGLRGVYKLANDANYNIFGYGEFGFVDNENLAVGAGVGLEFFVFKALNVKELSRLGFPSFGLNILPSTGFAFGGGLHYYF